MYIIRFGTKILNLRQRGYIQVKRELWAIVIAMKNKKEYFIGTSVVVETDYEDFVGMITAYSTPDITMLKWMIFIKSLNPNPTNCMK